MTGRRRGRRGLAAATLAMASLALAACGGADDTSGSGNRLTWYINPDSGGADPSKEGQAGLAKKCSDASDGRYSITVQLLPNDASEQRQQLLRRLAADDEGVDIMSIDPVFVAEFAEANFLEPVPEDKVETFTGDNVDPIVESAMWKDQMVAAPFWANTQVLWYRKSVAQEAGLDMEKPVTWEQVIEAAEKTGTTVGVQAMRYEGYMVWINALVAGAGGQVVENPGADGPDLKFGLDTDAGREAATIIRSISDKGLAGPAMGSSDETVALDLFQSDKSGFLLNWPYVYSALQGNEVDWLDDVGWTRYPQTVEGEESRPPLGGIELGVNQASTKKELAWEAIECISSEENQKAYMLGSGNPAANRKVYDDPEIKKAFPTAELIVESLDAGAPRPLTQYYGDVSAAIQREYSPPGSVDAETTPKKTTTLLVDVLKGDALL